MQFLGNFGKIVCWHPPRVGAPASGKSWIRHWNSTLSVLILVKIGYINHWNQNRNRCRFSGNSSAHYHTIHLHRNRYRNRHRNWSWGVQIHHKSTSGSGSGIRPHDVLPHLAFRNPFPSSFMENLKAHSGLDSFHKCDSYYINLTL